MTGIGQDIFGRERDPGTAAPDARAGPQQDARGPALRRVQGILSAQRGGVFRLLLRLLPAGSLRSFLRHLHREGLVDQRAHRADALSATKALLDGADAIIVATVSAIYGLGDPERTCRWCCTCRAATDGSAPAAAAPDGHAVHAQRARPDARHLSRARRRDRYLSRRSEREALRVELFDDEDRVARCCSIR